MNKDELILEIIEKVHDNVQRLEVKFDNLAEEQTRQNVIVERHEMRSTTAEKRLELFEEQMSERLQKLEKDANFAHNLIKILAALGGVTLFLIKVIPFFVR